MIFWTGRNLPPLVHVQHDHTAFTVVPISSFIANPHFRQFDHPRYIPGAMSVDEATFSQLVDMGIDPPLARAAAIRFSTAEAAINWCFGEGANVSPLYHASEWFPNVC